MKRHRDGPRGERQGSPGVTPRGGPPAAGPRPLASDAVTSSRPSSEGLAGLLAGGSKRGWLLGLLLVVATVLAYQPVWWGGFLWDDDVHITQNRMLVAPGGLKQIWSSPDSPQYYPLVFTSFRLERALWGLHPAGYHWLNLLLHGASAVLVWRVLRRLQVPGAWLAGAVFALHPVNVESVAWISQRKNTLSMFFYLLSVLFYLRFDQQPERPKVQSLKSKVGNPEAEVGEGTSRVGCGVASDTHHAPRTTHHAPRFTFHALLPPPSSLLYVLSLFAFALALLSKTAVSPLPVVLLGLAWWRRGKVTGRDVWRSAPFFIASLVLGLVTIWFERHQTALAVVRDDSFWSRLAVAGQAVWFYLYKALLPLALILIYPRWQIDPSKALSYVPGVLLVGALLLLWWNRRRWGRAWLFCAGYYVVMLLPVLGFVNIGFMSYSLVADHWQYFAMIAPIAVVAAGVATGIQSPKSKWPAAVGKGGGGSSLGVAVCGVMLVGLAGMTWRQSGIYADAETLWRATLAANPGCWSAHYNLGLALVQKGKLDEAIDHFQETLQFEPDNAHAHNNLGSAFLQKGVLDQAIVHFQDALNIQPHYAEARDNLGTALLQRGEVDEAIAQHQKALQTQPDYADAHNNLGIALLQKGRVDEAIAHYQQALQIKPDYAEAHNNLGTALIEKGKIAEAITQYQKALQIQPNYAEAHNNLALLLATGTEASLRNGTKAVELARQANELTRGRNPAFLRTLAAALAEAGRFSEAVQSAQQALELAQAAGQPDLAERLKNELKRYEAGLPLRQ